MLLAGELQLSFELKMASIVDPKAGDHGSEFVEFDTLQRLSALC